MEKIKTKAKAIKKHISKKRRAYMAARPHRSFRPTKRPRARTPLRIVTARAAVKGTLQTLWAHKKVFFGLSLIYMAATYIFIGGVAQSDFVDLKDATVQAFGGNFNSFGTAFSLLTSTMSGAFDASLTPLQQFLAVLIGVLFWLTLIWALRMIFAKEAFKLRDALYNAGAPLVAYVVTSLFIILQLTPGALGVFVLSVASSGNYLQGGIEVAAFAAGAVLLVCLSLYWLAGSLLSLVVVTLPNMYPWRALSISSELVVGRRLRILLHAGMLAVTVLALWVVVLLPILLLDSWLHVDWLPIVPIAVQFLSALSLVYITTYIYRVYRSLL